MPANMKKAGIKYNGGGPVFNSMGVKIPGMRAGGPITKFKKFINKGRDVVRDLVSAHRHGKAVKLKNKILDSNEYKIANQRFKQATSRKNKLFETPRNQNLEYRPHNTIDTDGWATVSKKSSDWKFPLKNKRMNKISQLMNKDRAHGWSAAKEKASGENWSRAKKYKDINTNWLRNLEEVAKTLKIKSKGGAAGSNGVL